MARYQYSVSAAGTGAVTGSQVYVYVQGTTNLLPETLYADPKSDTTLANPFTLGANPMITFYLKKERPVSLGVVNPHSSAPVPTVSTIVAVKPAQVVTTPGTMTVAGQVVNWFTEQT